MSEAFVRHRDTDGFSEGEQWQEGIQGVTPAGQCYNLDFSFPMSIF